MKTSAFLTIFALMVISIPSRADEARMLQLEPRRVHDTIKSKMLDLSTLEFRYDMNRTFSSKDGKSFISNIYSNGSLIAATEETIYQKGIPQFFAQDRLLQSIKCELQISDNKLNFTRYENGKIVKKDQEVIDDLTLVPDQIVPFIQQNWAQIMTGESIKFRLTVPCRLETVGFKIFMDEETVLNGKPVYLLKLKPKSFIIAAIVPSILLYFDKNSPHNILEYRGHVLPVRKIGDKIDDFDGIIQFTEVIPSAAPAY